MEPSTEEKKITPSTTVWSHQFDLDSVEDPEREPPPGINPGEVLIGLLSQRQFEICPWETKRAGSVKFYRSYRDKDGGMVTVERLRVFVQRSEIEEVNAKIRAGTYNPGNLTEEEKAERRELRKKLMEERAARRELRRRRRDTLIMHSAPIIIAKPPPPPPRVLSTPPPTPSPRPNPQDLLFAATVQITTFEERQILDGNLPDKPFMLPAGTYEAIRIDCPYGHGGKWWALTDWMPARTVGMEIRRWFVWLGTEEELGNLRVEIRPIE